MTDDQNTMVLIPLAGGEFLALPLQDFRTALERGREVAGKAQASSAPSAQPEPWLTAEGMEQATKVPASWWAEAARRGDVPVLRCGKYIRFRLTEAANALRPALGSHGADTRIKGPRGAGIGR